MFYQPRRGGSKAATRRVFRREPPRLRQLRWLRDIPLMAQPPLLSQEGSFHLDASRHLFKFLGLIAPSKILQQR